MKNRFFKYLLLVLFLCIAIEIQAQTQDLKFNLVSGTDGISLGKINAIAQDKYGFMWFSDQSNRSIIRYDGSAMTKYQNDPKNPNSLGGYYPETLYADSTGIIWIGFFGQGLDRFDPQTNTFTHYDHDPSDPESLVNDFVTVIRFDHLGNIWVGTHGGLDRLDPETGKFTHFRHEDIDSTSLSDNVVRAIYEDSEGTLWVGTGFAFDSDNTGGLNRFDRATGTFTRYLHDPDDTQSLIDNKVRSIFEDSNGNFWIGTRGDGLHSMNRETGKFKRHLYDPTDPQKLSSPPPEVFWGNVTFITEDAEKNLWIGSDGSGLNRYDPDTDRITHFRLDEGNDLSSWCAYPTNDGLIWIGTQNNQLLYKVDLYNSQIPFIKTGHPGPVGRFYEESTSVLWMGSYDGLVRSDLENGTTTRFRYDPKNPNSLSSNEVTKIIKDKQGHLWIGTTNGLNHFNPQTGIFTRYLHDPNDSTSLSINSISDIKEINGSKLWIGTNGQGLDRLDINTGIFTHFTFDPTDTTSINSNFVNVLFVEDENNLWIGSGGNFGLNRLNTETGRFKNYLMGLTILDIYKDSGGILWIGTQNGLYRYSMESDSFRPYINENTSLSINTLIWSIIEDDENTLWISSALGIFRLNQERDNLILYGKENNVYGDVITSSYKQLDGKILIGADGGYFGFYPDKLKTLSGSSNIYFTNLWLNNEVVTPVNGGPLVEPIIKAKEIRLNSEQNVFAISAGSIDFRASEDKKIYYLLENYDQDWRIANVGEKMNYFKIPSGQYVFRIKTANSSNGAWSENRINVIVLPPWWLTWWAYTLYGLVFIAGVFIVDRVQRKRLLEKERVRTQQKELEQAKEIEKAYKELKTTQSQLIHSEKMASLGELTAGIAHEIQNPLNFVNNFSDVNSELVEELEAEIKNGNYDEAVAIASSIKENEGKIEHHGKRAEEIVKSMLQHSRGSEGKKESTDINALADEYLRLAYHGMRARDKSFNADFKTELDPDLPKVNVVPQDMGRVLLNLINNAFQASSAKAQAATADSNYKPFVIVKTEGLDDNIQISIKDNGPGIPEQVRDKIFQPFFTTKATGEGTGLGLSLSYDIITKGHGGTIEVESKEGQGTTFLVILPY